MGEYKRFSNKDVNLDAGSGWVRKHIIVRVRGKQLILDLEDAKALQPILVMAIAFVESEQQNAEVNVVAGA